ncbi:hypothetical protein [Frankia sp. AgPm24]|nr:hypothetical protein [Frankia sp. AgPm24]
MSGGIDAAAADLGAGAAVPVLDDGAFRASADRPGRGGVSFIPE